jgi:hypothetical protein
MARSFRFRFPAPRFPFDLPLPASKPSLVAREENEMKGGASVLFGFGFGWSGTADSG